MVQRNPQRSPHAQCEDGQKKNSNRKCLHIEIYDVALHTAHHMMMLISTKYKKLQTPFSIDDPNANNATRPRQKQTELRSCDNFCHLVSHTSCDNKIRDENHRAFLGHAMHVSKSDKLSCRLAYFITFYSTDPPFIAEMHKTLLLSLLLLFCVCVWHAAMSKTKQRSSTVECVVWILQFFYALCFLPFRAQHTQLSDEKAIKLIGNQ